MANKSGKTIFARIWGFLISVRLTIILLIGLSAVCIIGTVVPQNASTHEYQRIYSPSTYSFLKNAGFLDMYNAWWFTLLMGAFTVNLIACTLNRIPRTRKRMSRANTLPDRASLESMACCTKFTFKQNPPEKKQHFIDALKGFLGNAKEQTAETCTYYSAEKGSFSYFAFYLTHLGVLIIIAGTLLGTLGFQGYMQLYEGEQSGTAIVRKTRETQILGFDIRCDKFEVTFYDRARMPKDYKSTLTVLEDGEEVLTKIIEVNDPLIYKGMYFYQSSYGMSPNKAKLTLGVTAQGSEKSMHQHVTTGERFTIEGTQDVVQVGRFIPDFSMDGKGHVFSRSDQPNNPAVQMQVTPAEGKPYTTWIFAKFPDVHQKPGQKYTFAFLQFQPVYYTGLQVTKDPGVWTVWIGCFVMLLGMYMAFFMSHRRIWLRIEEKDGYWEAVLAGTVNRNPIDFSKDFSKLSEQIRTIGKEKC